MPGFAEGGWNGPGAKHDIAGLVHADEVVWSKSDVARAGGVGVVEAMRKGLSGYADGGYVSRSPIPVTDRLERYRRQDAPQQSQPEASKLEIHMHEDASRAGQVQQRSDQNGTQYIDIWVNSLLTDGKVHKALKYKYGLSNLPH